MSDKIAVDLGSVQTTLLLPLWGRAMETRKTKPRLIDRKAVEIIDRIDYDFSEIASGTHNVTQLEWIARSVHIDRTIREFLAAHPAATIINVGCGLDTTFERVDNGRLFWYDLDLPDAIELRRKFIQESDRRKFLPCSFLDECWFNQIKVHQNVFLMAAGVLYYFEENQVREIFDKICSTFPGSEFVFDAASHMGVRMANRKVIQNVGLDEQSFLKWGIENASDIRKWNSHIEVIEDYPVYSGMKKGLCLLDRYMAFIADRHRIMFMVHLRM
jgi:O-methyltransferase involved in polyketide biosynthesis